MDNCSVARENTSSPVETVNNLARQFNATELA